MSEMNIVNLGNKKESKMYDKRLIVYVCCISEW